MDPTPMLQSKSAVDSKCKRQPKLDRKRKAPYRKQKWKAYERISVLQGPGLDFVSTTDTPNVEVKARRLVRSEVMKNYHSKRRDALKESPISCSIQNSTIVSWRGDPFVKFPVELTFELKEFLDCVFTDTRPVIAFYREVQLPNGLFCAGSFHQILANIAIWMQTPGCPKGLEGYFRRQEQQYHAKAIKGVQKQVISKEGSTSEGLIAAVCNFVTYSHMNGNSTGVNIHMNALEKILDLRGGMNTLVPSLQIYIFWFDTQIAAVLDTKPRFPPPTQVKINSLLSTYDLPAGAQTLSTLLRHSFPSLGTLMDVFDNIIRYGVYIEHEVCCKGAYIRKDFLNGCFLLWYHLLDFQSPEVGDGIFVVLESVRLSSLLFAAPVRRLLFGSTYSTAVQLRKLKHIVSIHSVESGGPLWHLRVWMVCMGFLEAKEEIDVLWWAGLWVETLAYGGYVGKGVLQLEDFNWKDGFAFAAEVTVEQGIAKTSTKEAAEDDVVTVVSSVIWLGLLQGKKYRDMCDRVDELLGRRGKRSQIETLVQRPKSKVEKPRSTWNA